ncbi:MAG: NAD(P)(+) transhydrogenase (Re/Si-specific) subunit beta [Desulforhopalus sp.]
MTLLIDFTVIVILIFGIWQFREPLRAKNGNLIAALALFMAFVLVLYRHGIVDITTVFVSLLVGAVAGLALARVVSMIQVPSMVAFQHGAGGVAAFLVSLVELSRTTHALSLVSEISGVLGLAIGSLTFSGSMIASAKLANKMHQAPLVLTHHNLFVILNFIALVVIGAISLIVPASVAPSLFVLEIFLGIGFGILLAIRIGGADMPVLISSLNATAGLAASLCGMVIENQLLIAFGATVAASGSILTYVMCKAMNRRINKVIFPDYKPQKPVSKTPSTPPAAPTQMVKTTAPADPAAELTDVIAAIQGAKKIIIVPGYGMALAKAQQDVATLAQELTAMGKDVKYAIHPVAGRMPGHMNVLLAEAGVDYDMLVEMETINPKFHATDLVFVVGACDVVNPTAIKVEGTPISGMPILKAHEAKKVVCCNFDRKPGYSGVENSLYDQDNCIMLEGDAKQTVQDLLNSLSSKSTHESSEGSIAYDNYSRADAALRTAKRIIIVPGYGMALAKAQEDIANLAGELIAIGKDVKYAIHPVAGRMPGHMNVLLAEAGVDYDMLVEMETINPEFDATDLVLVVGACDVVNPSAIEVEGTPISGMPILMAHKAKTVICCNFDRNPGYSGVENSLYSQDNTVLLEGDAKKSIQELQKMLVSKTTPQGPKPSTDMAAADATSESVEALAEARSVVIIPGYGMALAKAQFKLVELVSLLENRGVSVKYAIHPVAGRMPGHMNVLLAEAEVEYEDLLEMDDVNPLFGKTDVVIVVGACDVVNPAAIESEGTPISGMPILLAQDAKRIIVCNLDTNPGYSGVPNPLYNTSKTILLTGDARETISNLQAALQNIDV